jgi:hypothetical protein
VDRLRFLASRTVGVGIRSRRTEAETLGGLGMAVEIRPPNAVFLLFLRWRGSLLLFHAATFPSDVSRNSPSFLTFDHIHSKKYGRYGFGIEVSSFSSFAPCSRK